MGWWVFSLEVRISAKNSILPIVFGGLYNDYQTFSVPEKSGSKLPEFDHFSLPWG